MYGLIIFYFNKSDQLKSEKYFDYFIFKNVDFIERTFEFFYNKSNNKSLRS
jgi:hypothetical protein